MLSFFGIPAPPATPPAAAEQQKPFFGPAWRLSRIERDASVLGGGHWPAPPTDDGRERSESGLRFVSLLLPPFT